MTVRTKRLVLRPWQEADNLIEVYASKSWEKAFLETIGHFEGHTLKIKIEASR
jgi:hypothetical protein